MSRTEPNSVSVFLPDMVVSEGLHPAPGHEWQFASVKGYTGEDLRAKMAGALESHFANVVSNRLTETAIPSDYVMHILMGYFCRGFEHNGVVYMDTAYAFVKRQAAG